MLAAAGVTIIVLTPRWLGAILLAVGIAAGVARPGSRAGCCSSTLRARSLRRRDERLRKTTTGPDRFSRVGGQLR